MLRVCRKAMFGRWLVVSATPGCQPDPDDQHPDPTDLSFYVLGHVQDELHVEYVQVWPLER